MSTHPPRVFLYVDPSREQDAEAFIQKLAAKYPTAVALYIEGDMSARRAIDAAGLCSIQFNQNANLDGNAFWTAVWRAVIEGQTTQAVTFCEGDVPTEITEVGNAWGVVPHQR